MKAYWETCSRCNRILAKDAIVGDLVCSTCGVPEKPRRCQACVHFSPAVTESRGECKRHAPVMFNSLSGCWPIVLAADCCGDFKLKPESCKEAV